MSRAIALALLAAALVGCGKRAGNATNPTTGSGRRSAEVTPSGQPPPSPTEQQLVGFVRSLGRNAINSGTADPPNEMFGACYEMSPSVTEADIRAIRDPGFAFGLKFTSPKFSDAQLAACARFPSLVYLSVNKSRALTPAGLAPLAKMKNLRVLELTDLAVEDAWLSPLESLAEIRRLNLDGCYKVTDAGLVHLSEMTHLRELVLHNTKVKGSGLAALAKAKALTRVMLPEQTDGALQAMAKIGKLHALEEALTDAEERPGAAANATRFMIRGPVTDIGLREVSALPNLTRLHIESNYVTIACLPFLKTLKNLKRLDASFPLTDAERQELVKGLPGV